MYIDICIFITSIIILTYVGISNEDKKIIATDDWRRIWIIVMTYIAAITLSFIAFLIASIIAGLSWILPFLHIIIPILLIFFLLSCFSIWIFFSYFGVTIDSGDILKEDKQHGWKLTWILIVAWFNILVITLFVFIPAIESNSGAKSLFALERFKTLFEIMGFIKVSNIVLKNVKKGTKMTTDWIGIIKNFVGKK